MRNFTWLLLSSFGALAFCLLLAGESFITNEIDFNMAPWSRTIYLDRTLEDFQPTARMEYADLRVIHDGTADALYMAELPVQNSRCTIQVEFPWTISASSLMLLGDGEQTAATISALVDSGRGFWSDRGSGTWSGDNGVPPTMVLEGPLPVRKVRLTFVGSASVRLNALVVYVRTPRWRAWTLFLALTGVLPIFCGFLLVRSLLAWGRLSTLFLPGDNIGSRMLAGTICLTIFSLLWWCLPRHVHVDSLFILAIMIPTLWECKRWSRGGENVTEHDYTNTKEILPNWEQRLVAILLLSTSWQTLQVMVDTNLVAPRRMQPVDYLIAYSGARRLALEIPLSEEYAARPWMVHVLFAPWEHLLGRFSYWGYTGFLAGLNSLVLIPIALTTRRWGMGNGLAVAATVALLPTMEVFHAVGQRPASAGFALLALYWFLECSTGQREIAVGLALTTAMGIHPGAIFLLPGLLVYCLAWARPNAGLATAVRWLGVPVAAYTLWLVCVQYNFPAHRNVLMYYPIMQTLEPLDSNKSVARIVAEMSARQWWELYTNRLSQLQHYLWTTPLSDPLQDRFRWVSLPNCFGYALLIPLILAIRKIARHQRDWVILVIAGPLTFHHLFLGQAHAQFHITPVPFFGLAVVAAAVCRGYSMPRAQIAYWITSIVFVELFLRRCYPLYLLFVYPELRRTPPFNFLGIFGADRLSYPLLASLLPISWMVFAWWVFRAYPGAVTSNEENSATGN